MKIERTIECFIEQHHLLDREQLHLVATSGGADSVFLLLMLQQLGYRIEAVHCNFKLRGDESDRDESFVKNLCQSHDIPLHVIHFDTHTYAAIHKVSIEVAARQLRYSYFEQLLQDVGAATICVAHHKDDSVETILMNLIRGTGLHGLTGIKPRNGHVVRPLLCVGRHDIEQWLIERNLPFVTDSTNLVPDIVRNQLRLDILPRLQAINHHAAENILATARRLEESAHVSDAALQSQLKALCKDNSIAISELAHVPSPESLLYLWLSPYGFTPATIESIACRFTHAQAGRQWFSPTHQLTIHQGCLLLSAKRIPSQTALHIPEPGSYIYNEGKERLRLTLLPGSHIEGSPHTDCLDAAKVTFPLTLRAAKAGDRFHPFGMKGSKLVSDYLTDRHVPLPAKRQQHVLVNADGRILWLVGHRPDDTFCITPHTQQTLFIQHERS